MGKVRIYELAKDLGVSSKEIIDYLNELGMDITSHMSTVEDDIVDLLKDAFAVLEDTTIEEIEELEE